MIPLKDPKSQKYLDDPNRKWYAGRWFTLDQIAQSRKRSLRWYHDQDRELMLKHKREQWREENGRLDLIGRPPLTHAECGVLGGMATQDLYDRDPETWAGVKRSIREAGLKRTRTRLEREAANG